ncbi:biotin/lipoyl-binding carrier protein [Thermobifida alba]|uniref:Biotin/lipoyl-binding carrier protein n=1 Tax=Thermobifida alba TaxID=53522 RepID=A0ABY4L0P4_THEAE|nr:biotin/lipoyl-binding carrier protein [Thermobifida alba]UPT20496.1 biotin/lipoyl-binding carrier protein [Thermobifida alba]
MPHEVLAELPGNVWQVLVETGQRVATGEYLLVMETMKMEIPVLAEVDGSVAEVRVAPGDRVREGDTLVVVEP